MDIESSLSKIHLKERDKIEPVHQTIDSDNSRAASTSSVDGDVKEKFMELIKEARLLTENGDVKQAVKLYEKAQKLHYSDKLLRRIQKMKAFLNEQASEEPATPNSMMAVGQGFYLHQKLFSNLYDHQKEGVLWLWSLFQKRKGGILADDMGLGKTIQIIAFLAGMFDTQHIKCVMIIVPLSVMPNWLNEFNKWTPGINVQEYHGSSKKEREKALTKVRTRGGVLLITYGLVMTTKEILAERHGQEFIWDYVILDEGHKIKNATKTSKSVHHVPARNRIILTGTPVQNNLKELWSLFDYVHQGALLGTLRTFKMEFETPIIRARERDATVVEKKLGQEMAETLKKLIMPYFLRRTKAEVQANKETAQDDSSAQMPTLTRKNDLVIWLKLTEVQQKIYRDFTALDSIKELLMTKKSPLVALTILKKICDHPRLLSHRACLQLGLDGEDFDEEALERAESYESAVSQINTIPDEVLINESGKMIILIELLKKFKQEGRKTLIFSQSRKILDIIQKVVCNLGHKVLRLDGTVSSLVARDELVKKFQKDETYTAFLLTIQVGGVGLTITAADRVIIFDPNWNPATDAQAVDRAYRIGQQKNVVVYRLISCGTVEEKIYRRQVFKDSITRQTTGSTKNPYRYFTKMELRELFTLDDPNFSKTQQQLQELHSHQRVTDESLDEHIAFLYSLDIFGISDHDLMYKHNNDASETEEDDMEASGQDTKRDDGFIQHKIQKAQFLIAEESNIPSTYEERSKGLMKYPSVSGPTTSGSNRPSNYYQPPKSSPLFTKVPSGGESEDSPIDVSDDGADHLAHEIQNISMAQEEILLEKQIKKDLLSPIKNQPSPSRKALQPLTSDEIRNRSPQVASRPTKVVDEEIIISPDIKSPVVSLVKTERLQPKLSPVLLFTSPSTGSQSPKSQGKLSGAAPDFKVNNSVGASPRKFSTPKSAKNSLTKKLFLDHSLIKGSPQASPLNTLAEDSQNSQLFSPSSHQTTSSVYGTPPSDTSSACRRLSFIEDTPETNQRQGQISSKPAARSSFLMERSLDINELSQNFGSAGSIKSTFEKSSDKSSSSAGHKRRSVCLKQPIAISSDEDSEGEDSALAQDESIESHQDEQREDEPAQATYEDEDKENDPIQFRRAGKRNAIVSDSESDAGSNYIVTDDDNYDDGEDNQHHDGSNQLQRTNIERSQVEESMEECSDHQTEDKHMEEEEEDLNPVFIQLVHDARRSYKQGNYMLSLEFVEKALAIEQPEELVAMAEKIRGRIASSS